MQYFLPFHHGQSIIELGGGDKPQFRPNLDVRAGPTIDIVSDLNQPFPLPNNSYDGIYCSYCIEHVSWRKIRQFISESCRILKPGGVALFITANLLEQARILLVENDNWEDKDICGIFGDQDYPENSHKTGFSPKYARKLFIEAGFSSVVILPHPNCVTDMLIEARK